MSFSCYCFLSFDFGIKITIMNYYYCSYMYFRYFLLNLIDRFNKKNVFQLLKCVFSVAKNDVLLHLERAPEGETYNI